MSHSADRLALDRASVRTFDQDGHLHVATANISKAAVNPYLGREIPDCERLGLSPDKIYKLLRDPGELEKAASSFTGKPLLIKHTPVGADDHPHEKVVGAIGEARYEHPYLKAPLHIWPGEAINLIKSGDQSQISCGYRYGCDMTPGTYEGERYDGVMRSLSGNHAAIVATGRAGADCVIGDSKENLSMSLTVKKAVGVKFPPNIIEAAKAKLAEDANLADLAALIDAFSEEPPVPGIDPAAPDPDASAPAVDDEGDDDAEDATDPAVPPAPDGEDPIAKVKAFLAGKLSDEDMQQLDALVAAIGKTDEQAPPVTEPAAAAKEDDPKDKGPAETKDPADTPDKAPPQAKDKENEDMVTKPAMDAAIAEAEKRATVAVLKAQRDLRDAERAVRPYVGELAVACDSAEQVYRTALKMRGVAEADQVHVSALPALLKMLPTHAAAQRAAASAPIALDAASSDDFAKRFPNASRLSA